MAPQLTEDEIDDLIFSARAGEEAELTELLSSLAEREKVSKAEVLIAAKDEGKSTCLHMATGNGHIGIVRILIEQFASRPEAEKQAFLDEPNEYGNTGLHWAALGGHLDTVKLLVESGASPALANDKNYVPLDLASFNDKVDVVDYFLSKSGSLESQNDDGLDGAVNDVKIEEDDEKGNEAGSSQA